MLHLILADSEIETIPPVIAGHRVVLRHARRRGRKPTELILNSGLHYPAMRGLPDMERRGRPDIAHFSLLLALDSPLNRSGLLRVHVHTRHNMLIEVHPSARLPVAQHRFEGLLEQLFLSGRAPPQEPLLTLERASLREIVDRISPAKTIVLTDRGERREWGRVFEGASPGDDVAVIIGGFPHGDFLSPVNELAGEMVCIDPDLLLAPTVVARAIGAYEEFIGLQGERLGLAEKK
jgi:rRNA small subunit pseudouridine methyltransferase Nep1